VLVLVTVAMSLAAQPAAAHETRNVGPYRFVVGWLEEPAFAGITNAVSLVVTDTRIAPPKAMEGLEKTLTVDVFQGGSTTPFSPAFRARFGAPGSYAADIIPTRDGGYRFVIKGKIESLDINEVFESGPGRFDDVKPVSALQYPDKVPTGAELSRSLDDIRSTAEQMRLIAIAALVLGVIAVAMPFLRKRT
jgi:hypothetical protein